MASFASERLEEALGYWQDTCWMMEAFIASMTQERKLLDAPDLIAPQLHNWRRFEQVVFNNTTPFLELSKWGTPLRMRKEFRMFDVVHRFPFEFFEWSRKSRRVFHLPPGLWQVFIDATYPNIHWKDILLPFESFVITLDGGLNVTIGDEDLSFVYDTILVARTSMGNGVSARLIRAPLSPKEDSRIPPDVKHRFEALYRRGDSNKSRTFLEQKFNEWQSSIVHPPSIESAVFWPDTAVPGANIAIEPADLVDSLEEHEAAYFSNREHTELEYTALSDAIKVVVGWCLYLRTVSTSEILWRDKRRSKQKRGTRGVTGIITQPEHICTVLGEARLDPTSYGLAEQRSQNSGFFKRPHWRRAHYKRPNYSPLTAKKTVEVPPRLIRKDLVPYFGIIGGTKTEVLPEE